MHRAFVGSVPFEALAAQLGEAAPLDEAALAERVVTGAGVVGPRDAPWLTNHLTPLGRLHPHASSPGFRIAGSVAAPGAFDEPHERPSTSPDSPFVRTLVVQRPLTDRIVTLRARTLSVAGPGVACRRVLADRTELAAMLDRAFGIDPDVLGDQRLGRLWSGRSSSTGRASLPDRPRARGRRARPGGAPPAVGATVRGP